MKRNIGLVLGVFVLVLVACKDNSDLLNTSGDSSPQLASEEFGQVIIKSRTGDGPLIEKVVTPVRWDGKSELRSGVVYRWNNYEEALAAYETKRPDKYKILKERWERRKLQISGFKESNAKTKAPNRVALAYSPTVTADAWVGGGKVYANSVIDQPAPSSPANVSLYLSIDWMYESGGPIINLEEYDEYFPNTTSSHFYATQTWAKNCPSALSAGARLYVSSEDPDVWNAEDDDACGF